VGCDAQLSMMHVGRGISWGVLRKLSRELFGEWVKYSGENSSVGGIFGRDVVPGDVWGNVRIPMQDY